MAIESEIYADGIYQIHVLENTIRLDFMRLQPSPENNKPVAKPFERVILTPQGFLRTFEAMQQICKQLEEHGIIRRTPPPTENKE